MHYGKCSPVWVAVLLAATICHRYADGANYTYGHENPADNLLSDSNSDFEEDTLGAEWVDISCDIQRYNGTAHSGTWSVQAYNRTKLWSGLRRVVFNLTLDQNYYYSIFVNFMNVPSNGLPYKPNLRVRSVFLNGTKGPPTIISLVIVTPSMINQWIHFAGIFKTPDIDIEKVEFYFTGVPAEVDVLYDAVALQDIPADPDWKQDANSTIHQIRQNTLTLQGTVPNGYNNQDVDIHVEQRKHEFGFGAAIHADAFNKVSTFGDNYRAFFFDNFERTTMANAMKWRLIEKIKGEINYQRVDDALVVLDAAGYSTQCHNIFWNGETRVPDWVANLTGSEMVDEMDRRIEYFVPYYNDSCVHFDVVNEHISSDFFEVATGNDDILLDIFNKVSAHAPNTPLLLNEYQVITDTGHHMSALNEMVRYLVGNNATLDGLGLQNHHENRPDPEVVRFRLAFVAQNELPIYISELTVDEPDDNNRADYLDDLMHLFFSDPNVKAITHWGFVDLYQAVADRSLADGENVTANAAGLRWHYLVKEKWLTNVTQTPTTTNFNISFPAFHGDYRMRVYYDGSLLTTTDFSLPSGADKTVNVPF